MVPVIPDRKESLTFKLIEMKISTLYDFISYGIFRKYSLHSDYKVQLPEKRILLTVDLDEPLFDSHVKNLMEMLSRYGVAFTIFSPNTSSNGEVGYAALEQMITLSKEYDIPLEIASHSMSHEPLGKDGIVDKIKESLLSFKENGLVVRGFRAPYLCTEKIYHTLLQEMSKEDGIIEYDSSILFEGSLFVSRMHDFFPWKSPHKVSHIWELPISCLDDYHLFVKLKRDENFVSTYWKRKVDTNLRKYNYFLFLVHPYVIGNHLSALSDFLYYCQHKHSKARFINCLGLVEELDSIKTDVNGS